MKYSGIYIINNPGAQLDASLKLVQSLIENLESRFPKAKRHQEEWRLNHRLLRDVPPPAAPNTSSDDPPPYAHSYQHLLHVSQLNPSLTYSYIQPAAEADSGVVAAIPYAQTDAHYELVVTRMALLWSPMRILDIPHGITYSSGDFTIHIGYLRAKRPGMQSTNVLSPGIVVCVTTIAGASDDQTLNNSEFPSFEEPLEFDVVQASIRALWDTIKQDVAFGRADIREFMQMEQDFDTRKEKEQEAVVRMWCDALRTRA